MLVDEKVLRLQIAVQDTAGVAVHQAEVKLVRKFLEDSSQLGCSKRVPESIDAKRRVQGRLV